MFLLQTHLKACLYQVLTCPNEHCHETMEQRELKRHMTISCLWRITECEHCNEQHPACRIQVVYDDHIYGESLYYSRNIHKLGFRSDLKCSGLAESSVITAHAIPERLHYMRDVKLISFRIMLESA